MQRWSGPGSLLILVAACIWAASPTRAQQICGAVVTLAAHGDQSLSYSFSSPPTGDRPAVGAMVLLVGGGGDVSLDDGGCARRLAGEWLIRSMPLFQRAGFATALVDAPTDYREIDGLADFRGAPEHAEDIGRVVADLRQRTGLRVFLLGNSRGTISAANAAARLTGDAAPDAVVLTSPITSGNARAKKAWVAQTAFDPPLAKIRMPLLVVSHAADTCVRTPPNRAGGVVERAGSTRKQLVTIEGGPAAATTYDGLAACEGRTPHGFVGQEAEVAAGIVRFLAGGRF
jgi:hypothetical protein